MTINIPLHVHWQLTAADSWDYVIFIWDYVIFIQPLEKPLYHKLRYKPSLESTQHLKCTATHWLYAVTNAQKYSITRCTPPAHLPVMEHRETESLSLCVCTQVSLKAKRINGRNERFDCVEGRAWDGCVLGHMTSSPCQHSVDRGHTISWSLHLHKIVGLHQTRSGLQCVCVCVCVRGWVGGWSVN